MKRKDILLATVLTLGIGLTSCKGLDLSPKDKMTEPEYFKNATELELFSNPFYDDILDKSPYDKQSDIMVLSILSEVMEGGNRRTVPASGKGWSWGVLRDINTLLEYIDRCEDKEAVNHYTAVAKFFRAFFYYDKVVRFGDVPWYDKPLEDGDEGLYKARDSRELVMTKIIEDLDDAIKYLPAKKSAYRVNKWSALALKSRVTLFEGTFRKYHGINLPGHDYKYYLELAEQSASEIIQKSPYKIYNTGHPERDYLMLFATPDANKEEYLLAIKFDYALGIRNNTTAFTIQPSQGLPGITRKFVNTFLMKDGSRFTDQSGWETMTFNEEVLNRDPRLAQSIRTPGYTRINTSEVLPPDLNVAPTGYQPIKFVQDPASNSGNNDRTGSSDVDLPVFRLAEVMLNYVEAKAELGTLEQADLDKTVKVIRDRAGMPNMTMADANANPDPYLTSDITGYPNVQGTNKGVILEIRRERTIELHREGLRFDDIRRWKAGYVIDQAITGMYFPGPGEYDLSGDGIIDTILYTNQQGKPKEKEGVVTLEIGKKIFLTGGDKGYLNPHHNSERNGFNEQRDYFYPIPIDDRTLNPNLTQNPGWVDGLDK